MGLQSQHYDCETALLETPQKDAKAKVQFTLTTVRNALFTQLDCDTVKGWGQVSAACVSPPLT